MASQTIKTMADTELPKILCVDDEPDILDSLNRTLRRRFDVTTATSPDEAQNRLESGTDFA
ncbi:MAG: hypothetical protein AAF203_07470, partial [Pseudomonadota bacterium]